MRKLAIVLFLAFTCVAQRGVISLDGTWQLLPDAKSTYTAASLPSTGWRAAQVPMSIQAQFADLRDFAGTAWYRVKFLEPSLDHGQRLLLHFGAVDYNSTVWINGTLVGTHEGGYTPFDLDITAAAHHDDNEILVKVFDPPDHVAYQQIPHGKQDWYVQTTGVWQSVSLEPRPAAYLDWVHALTPNATLEGFALQLVHPEALPVGATAIVTITTPAGKHISQQFPVRAALAQTLPFTLPTRSLWSPEHPRLYTFSVELSNGGEVTGKFGLRTIIQHDGALYLNGKRLFLRGALDQAFYPDGVYTPPSEAYLRDEMETGKRMGLNLLRLHIKTPDPRYLDAADATGMLVWYEIPNWDTLTPESERRARALFQAALARDWNHPAIVLQSIINESWGADLKQPADRAWLKATSAWARAQEPDRLVDDNTACCDNFHLLSDLADFHNYNSIPDHAAAWDTWVKDFASRPKWLWSPYGDAEPGDAPLIVSEFGNWGLPSLPNVLPWWFDRGGAITKPGGVFERMRAAGLPRVFGDYAGLAASTEQHEWSALRYEIESMRLQPAIQGYVITEFTDVNWENNGLLTMWRQPKNFSAELGELQRPVVVIAKPDASDYAASATAHVAVWVSNQSAARLSGARVSVDGQLRTIPDTAPGAVASVGNFDVPVAHHDVRLAVRSASGQTLDARNLALGVVPILPSSVSPLAEVATTWTQAAALAGKGGAVLLIADTPAALAGAPGLTLVPRKGDLTGDWVSNFNWIDTSRPPFSQFFAFGPILDSSSAAITPQALIGGVPAAAAASPDALSGFFLGWVHDAYPTTLQLRYASGKIIVTTLELTHASDPLAAALLTALRRYAVTCSPSLALP